MASPILGKWFTAFISTWRKRSLKVDSKLLQTNAPVWECWNDESGSFDVKCSSLDHTICMGSLKQCNTQYQPHQLHPTFLLKQMFMLQTSIPTHPNPPPQLSAIHWQPIHVVDPKTVVHWRDVPRHVQLRSWKATWVLIPKSQESSTPTRFVRCPDRSPNSSWKRHSAKMAIVFFLRGILHQLNSSSRNSHN